MQIKSYTLEDNTIVTPKESDGYRQQAHFEYNLLRHLDGDEIKEYAEKNLDMVDEEDSLSCDVWSIENESLIEVLEKRGFSVYEGNQISELDYTDDNMLYEIVEKFKNGSWEERKYIYRMICQ